MENQQELATALIVLKDQVNKANAEIIAKIDSLEEIIISQGNVSPEVSAALEELKLAVQSVDNIVPDQE